MTERYVTVQLTQAEAEQVEADLKELSYNEETHKLRPGPRHVNATRLRVVRQLHHAVPGAPPKRVP